MGVMLERTYTLFPTSAIFHLRLWLWCQCDVQIRGNICNMHLHIHWHIDAYTKNIYIP